MALRGLAHLGSLAVVVAAGLFFLGVGLGPRTGLYRTMTVLSGSMQPTFAPGDVVVVTPEPLSQIRVGQVIVYAIPIADHHVESHRVIEVRRSAAGTLVRTKGDANAAADPWTARLEGTQVWRVRAVVPMLGQAIIWLRNPRFHVLLLFAAPLLLVLFGLNRIWRRSADVAPC